jgi:dephospho-CoA kinase
MAMKLVGLTGGIGSGKSTVAGMFGTLGIPVYPSDQRARRLMEHNATLRNNIKGLLGDEAFLADGTLNRAWIAQQVFSDPVRLAQLNAIVHPAVYMDLLAWSEEDEQKSAPYLIQESAILFEEDLTDRLTAVILVVADERTRIERVIHRDQTSEQAVRQRMKNQWPDEDKIPLSDYVIYNDGERSLIDQVMDIHQMIIAAQ